jgi:drug/metabolite transporter (DMT)-like permease
MSGVMWGIVAALGFGFFQSFNRRAQRGIDAFLGTFILLVVSVVVLVAASLLTEDLSQLQGVPLKAFVSFGLAGFVHFFLGWTFISISQNLVGASRTGALIGATPLFAFAIGLLVFGEVLSLPVIAGIVLIIAGVYLVSNG